MHIKDIFRKISSTINSEYRLTTLGEHRGLKGSKREKILRNFLEDMLPQQYSLGDGEVFDSEGNISKQTDIIICNGHMPIFRYSKYLLFYPIESVYGVCEVKTCLDKESLREAIENIQSVKKMKLSLPNIFQGTFHERVYGCVFAYDSSDVKTIKNNWNELYMELGVPNEERIDMLCVHDKFIALSNPDQQGYRSNNGFVCDNPLFLNTGKDTLMHFVPIMTNGFNKPISQGFDFFKYIGKLNIPTIS